MSTLGGLIQARLDRAPVAGDRLTWNGLSLEIIDVDGLRINHVRVAGAHGSRATDAGA